MLLQFFMFFLILIIQDSVINAKNLAFHVGELDGTIQLKYKPESFYVKWANLLNNDVDADKIILTRSTVDVNFDLAYKKDKRELGQFFASFRNKATWGNPESNAQTTETNLKLLEVVFGEHKHFITRHVMWIRELWFKFNVNEALGLNFKYDHYFTLGAFPFELGRGIALGNAFAVGPRVLGFYSDNAIDQYAFGFKLSGQMFCPWANYDVYGEYVENKSDTFSNTGAKIRGQQFGRRRRQERGSGNINFIVAARSKLYPINSVALEPYIMYNSAPEQKIDFPADSNSKLASLGLAGEFVLDRLEFGFDTAINIGRQKVLGWDRNVIEFENRTQTVPTMPNPTPVQTAVPVNSRVREGAPNGPKAIYVPNGPVQQLVNTSAEDASQNGLPIGTVDGVTYFNDINRFRNPYSNAYKGWMFVADAAYSLNTAKTFKIAATVGAASGDRDPNRDINNPNESQVDGDFKGFIALQELYSGYRVQSVFLLGGTGRAPRPLFIPTSFEVYDRLPTIVSGFTNLIFVGSAIHWYPKYAGRAYSIRPNVLAYWQQKPTNSFDRQTNMSSTRLASNYLGLEANALIDVELFKDFKFYAVGSVFIPGTHFKDIKGTPLTRDQLKLLDNMDVTGIINDVNPFIGDNIAFTINIGLECRF